MNPANDIEKYLKAAFEPPPGADLDESAKLLILAQAPVRAWRFNSAMKFAACACILAFFAGIAAFFAISGKSAAAPHSDFVFNRDADREIFTMGRTTVFQNSSAEIICVKSSRFQFDRRYEEAVAAMSIIQRNPHEREKHFAQKESEAR